MGGARTVNEKERGYRKHGASRHRLKVCRRRRRRRRLSVSARDLTYTHLARGPFPSDDNTELSSPCVAAPIRSRATLQEFPSWKEEV